MIEPIDEQVRSTTPRSYGELTVRASKLAAVLHAPAIGTAPFCPSTPRVPGEPLRYDRRLPRVLHVLLHMQDAEQPMTSAQIGQYLQTNSSFVRRTMAGLRERGWVSSSRGQGGGWTLTTALEEISLLDLYDALGSPSLFAIATSEDTPTCLLERAANTAVDSALEQSVPSELPPIQALTTSANPPTATTEAQAPAHTTDTVREELPPRNEQDDPLDARPRGRAAEQGLQGR